MQVALPDPILIMHNRGDKIVKDDVISGVPSGLTPLRAGGMTLPSPACSRVAVISAACGVRGRDAASAAAGDAAAAEGKVGGPEGGRVRRVQAGGGGRASGRGGG